MIKLHHYSREKFFNFTAEQQAKALLQMLCALESNIADPEYRQGVIPDILECLDWCKPAVRMQFISLSSLAEQTSPHDFLKLITPLIRLKKHKYNENDSEIIRFDGNVNRNKIKVPFPLTVVLDNLRSAYNVGSIFRTAECVAAKSIYLCGITPAPPHSRLSKTAMGTEKLLEWQHYSDTEEAISKMKKDGIPILALETTTKAKSLFDFKLTLPVAVIMGNEALGIEEKILKLADEVIYIPVHGWKNSLNVSNAFALAAYYLSGITKM